MRALGGSSRDALLVAAAVSTDAATGAVTAPDDAALELLAARSQRRRRRSGSGLPTPAAPEATPALASAHSDPDASLLSRWRTQHAADLADAVNSDHSSGGESPPSRPDSPAETPSGSGDRSKEIRRLVLEIAAAESGSHHGTHRGEHRSSDGGRRLPPKSPWADSGSPPDRPGTPVEMLSEVEPAPEGFPVSVSHESRCPICMDCAVEVAIGGCAHKVRILHDPYSHRHPCR